MTIPTQDPPKLVDQSLQRLYDYWIEKRGDRSMPSRADLDPLDMGYMLGHLILIDVLRDPMRFRIRLHGTELARRAGYDLTGKMLDELPITEFRTLAVTSFTKVAETGQIHHAQRDRVLDNRRYAYETLMLPLSNDGQTVNMLLVGLRYHD